MLKEINGYYVHPPDAKEGEKKTYTLRDAPIYRVMRYSRMMAVQPVGHGFIAACIPNRVKTWRLHATPKGVPSWDGATPGPLTDVSCITAPSADPEGKPWSERKKYVWWDETAKKWTGYDVPDFMVNRPPSYRPSRERWAWMLIPALTHSL